ncbi:MAG TPA: hypothetical protein VGS22_17035 [Thermoanaerobaculia bacterium]|jgi:hypothetical protein|nr:hypothetical protein [Thermoanaerobaculia bacterium]
MPGDDRIALEASLRIARLEARVASLEAALVRRSTELRELQRLLPSRELLTLWRLSGGLPPVPRGRYDLDVWRETTALSTANVEETLLDLWQSLAHTPAASR